MSARLGHLLQLVGFVIGALAVVAGVAMIAISADYVGKSVGFVVIVVGVLIAALGIGARYVLSGD